MGRGHTAACPPLPLLPLAEEVKPVEWDPPLPPVDLDVDLDPVIAAAIRSLQSHVEDRVSARESNDWVDAETAEASTGPMWRVTAAPPSSESKAARSACLTVTALMRETRGLCQFYWSRGQLKGLRKLGQGEYGRVVHVLDKDSREEFALKTTKPSPKDLEKQEEELEAAIMKYLCGHPNIVRLVEAALDSEKSLFLLMELCKGGSLASERWAHITPLEVGRVLFAVASVLMHMHARGVCHADLKAANVFLARDPPAPGGRPEPPINATEVRVSDFGLANVVDGRRRRPMRAIYMSPEAIKGGVFYTPAHNLWTLGTLAHFLLTRAHAFASFEHITKGIMVRAPRRWSGLDERAQHLVGQLLCADPGGRPTALEVMADPWVAECVCDDAPLLARFEAGASS